VALTTTLTGVLAFGALCAGLACAAPAAATPGLNERVVADPASGIALFGYDPVAYFTEGRPVLGKRLFEAEWGGAAWRFASAANRAAFLSAPEVYAPQFGGYDPLAVARGRAAAGHPQVFAVLRDRLYLFRSPDARDTFADPAPAVAEWPAVERDLTP